MSQYLLAFDLGTGGNKASLYDGDGQCLAANFVAYATQYPAAGRHEQRPTDWWNAVVQSTNQLLAEAKIDKRRIAAIGISGHSLGVVPLDHDGALLRDSVPIWSDSRSEPAQLRPFFEKIDEPAWYMMTGNGFPPALYSVFKILWYRHHEPEMFARIHKIIGTKDFINFKLTGRMLTDYSYASGTGVYDLLGWQYSDRLLAAANLPRELFPEIVASAEVIGELTTEAADALGLPRHVRVVAGGVDNSCMALGAGNIAEGSVYNSLGSSSWIAATSAKPLLEPRIRPYVFTHVMPGLFNSAVAIFSAGTSFRWVRDHLCGELVREAEQRGVDAYELMTALAAQSPVGAKGLLFNPNLAGGTALDESPTVRGALLGLDLGHTQADVVRAAMEGIALGLRRALDALRTMTPLSGDMRVVGGGSRSSLWRQIYADVYNMRIVKSDVDQQAAALGAAALAAVGAGLWSDFRRIDEIHRAIDVTEPIPEHVRVYDRLLGVFAKAGKCLAEVGQATGTG